MQHVGYVTNKNGATIAYDGVLVVNTWNVRNGGQKVFLLKNGIFEKYRSYGVNYGCNVPLGLPGSEEIAVNPADINSATQADRNQVWKQDFRYGTHYHNRILAYNEKDSNTFRVHYVVDVVADIYHAQGSQTQYLGLPTGDTYSDVEGATYCKQWFEFGYSVDRCVDLNYPFTVNSKNIYGRNTQKQFSFELRHSPNREVNRYRYDPKKSRNVWIISHGMNGKTRDFYDMSEAINKQDSNAIVLLVNWEEAAATFGRNPTLIDQHIQPIARGAANKLHRWGIQNGSTVNLVGHSMGTLMITEIAKELQENYGVSRSNQHILLDPPSYYKVFEQFDVNDGESGNNSIYTKNLGFSDHADAKIIRAYSGLANNGTLNIAGNWDLNHTAKENVVNYYENNGGVGNIHGAVHKSWEDLIRWNSLNDENHLIYGNGIEGYERTTYFNSFEDNKTQSVLIVTDDGNNEADSVQVINSSEVVQSGRSGKNTYYGFDPSLRIVSQQRTITINDFDDAEDKISLFRERVFSRDGEVVKTEQRYWIDPSRPSVIRSRVVEISEGQEKVIVSDYDFMIVRGSQSYRVNDSSLEAALDSPNQIYSPFILRYN